MSGHAIGHQPVLVRLPVPATRSVNEYDTDVAKWQALKKALAYSTSRARGANRVRRYAGYRMTDFGVGSIRETTIREKSFIVAAIGRSSSRHSAVS